MSLEEERKDDQDYGGQAKSSPLDTGLTSVPLFEVTVLVAQFISGGQR